MVNVQQKKKVQVRKKGGHGKLYALLGLVAIVALAALTMNRGGGPKPDTFEFGPSPAPVTAQGFSMGSPNAPVTVQEWADFECPGCMQFATLTEPDVRQRLVETGQVRFEYFFFPLTSIHRNAASAAYAAACAGDQNKFWEMHDAIFNGFSDWARGATGNPKRVFRGYAERIGLNVGTWEECYDSDKHRALIQSHVTAGVQRGVEGTPSFFFNGRKADVTGYDQFKARVDAALAESGRAAPQGAAPGDSAPATPVPAGAPPAR